jgi:hypothetical protein
MSAPRPPKARLEFTLSVSADSVDDLAEKLCDPSNEIALRDEGDWDVSSSRGWTYRTAFDPTMTAERYMDDLIAWHRKRVAERASRADA